MIRLSRATIFSLPWIAFSFLVISISYPKQPCLQFNAHLAITYPQWVTRVGNSRFGLSRCARAHRCHQAKVQSNPRPLFASGPGLFNALYSPRYERITAGSSAPVPQAWAMFLTPFALAILRACERRRAM